MKITRKLSRRSFLGAVAGGAVAGGGALLALSGPAQAQSSDSDTGRNADPIGRGRRNGAITDADTSDPVGRGRGRTGVTDSDPGDSPNYGRRGATDADPSDPVNRGRGRTGITDNDPGDVPNYGRGRRSCSDSDRGGGADPVGRGRRC